MGETRPVGKMRAGHRLSGPGMDVIRLLRDLIALPSVNPAFGAPGESVGGEQAIGDYILAVAARRGLDVDWQEVFPGRRNIMVRLGSRLKCRHRVLLAPHLDTVAGAASAFVPVRRSDRLYGRGACDTKASVAAMLTAVARVARDPGRPAHTEVLFLGLVDEEHGQSGSRAWGRLGLHADLAIVGEPTRLRVVTAHKGDAWLEVRTRGQAAHSAQPERGRNAVHRMARVVDLLETVYQRQLSRRRHPLLGAPTVNVGRIDGGTQPNIVPDSCRIEVDRRMLPGETLRGVLAEMARVLRRPGLAAHCADLKGADCPPLETPSDHPWVQRLLHVNRQRRPTGVPFFCDAAILSAAGIPSVVFGPGDIAQAHTDEEWVSCRCVDLAAERLTRFLRALP